MNMRSWHPPAGKDGEPLLSLALVQAVVADAECGGTS
jgi:hypothetical protein